MTSATRQPGRPSAPRGAALIAERRMVRLPLPGAGTAALTHAGIGGCGAGCDAWSAQGGEQPGIEHRQQGERASEERAGEEADEQRHAQPDV